MITLADRVTLARLVLAPLIVACYLLLPAEHRIVFWVVGLLCGLAEYTDLLDGQIARRRGEVSDFGKLADPFCDVFYRMTMFLVYLLPVAGVGYGIQLPRFPGAELFYPMRYAVGDNDDYRLVYGMVPWLPVWLMVLREIVAGALRSMAATKGLVLAAGMSGKIKAWVQGVTIITIPGLSALFGGPHHWAILIGCSLTWLCACLSLYSISEYLYSNRAVLATLIQRKPIPPADEGS